jgi:hypothetical protein
VAPAAREKSVCFFIHRGQGRNIMNHGNHFFPVLFDYEAHKAYAFGVSSCPESVCSSCEGMESGWQEWLGPGLWKLIGNELDWRDEVGDTDTVTVVTKNWLQVCSAPSNRF